jgi:dimethylhistidine N-methyltransferase
MLDVMSPAARQQECFAADVVAGLSAPRKTLPSRWLYDDRGCDLFEDITRLPEYYPTRTETAILRASAGEIGAFLRDGVLLEYGAGAGVKSRLVLAAARTATYVPIDIAGDFLDLTARQLRDAFPAMVTLPVVADFTGDFDLPQGLEEPRSAFFPGSTIGNLDEREAHDFLLRMRHHTGEEGRAVIGIDLRKNLEVLLRAYDDAAGVTAAFNLNLLARINRELAGSFDLAAFAHEARWNESESAVEMHLVSLRDQRARVGAQCFDFAEGETIHTESSRKYDLAGFSARAGRAGWSVAQVWTDPDMLFAVVGLEG